MDVPESAVSDEVLQQPTRARLFALLTEHKDPVSTEQAAARLGLHRSGVRVHLERLEAAGLGFQPRPPSTEGNAVCFELGNCPYRAAVRANQPVVCTLHRGLTQGLL